MSQLAPFYTEFQTEKGSSISGANIITTLGCSGWTEFCQDFNISGKKLWYIVENKNFILTLLNNAYIYSHFFAHL